MTNPYEVLGISRSANASDIRRAYKELAAKYHPDRYEGDPAQELVREKLQQVNDAYAILKDAKKRAAYDRGAHGFPQNVTQSGSKVARTPQQVLLRTLTTVVVIGLMFRLGPMLLRLFGSILGRTGGIGVGALVVPVAAIFLWRRRRSKR